MAPKKDKGKGKAPRPASSSEEDAALAEALRRSRRDVGDPGAGPSTRRYPTRVRRAPPMVPYKRESLPALDWTIVRPPSPTACPPRQRRPRPQLQPRQHDITTYGHYDVSYPLHLNRLNDLDWVDTTNEAWVAANEDPNMVNLVPVAVAETRQPRPHHAGASSSSSASTSKGKGGKPRVAKSRRNGGGGVGTGGYYTRSMQQLQYLDPPLSDIEYRRTLRSFVNSNPPLFFEQPLALQGAEPPRRKASTSSSSSASASGSRRKAKKKRT